MSGLLIDGKLHEIPGVEVISPNQFPWAKLAAGDCEWRSTSWVRQIIIHTTKGMFPQKILPGKGAGGKDKVVADFWRGDPEHSAAHLVVDTDGSIVCLADLMKISAYHATFSNDFSIGIEMYQMGDGGIYEATLESTVKLVLTLCDLFGIPLQSDARQYANAPLARMVPGGKDMVGVFGHRDNTNRRGRGDPGDIIFLKLRDAGMIQHFYDAKPIPGDKAYWSKVQTALNKTYGLRLGTDGVCGPKTVEALRKYGLWNGGVFRKPPIP